MVDAVPVLERVGRLVWVCVLFWVPSLFASEVALQKFLKSQNWVELQKALIPCQDKLPRAFDRLEWIRFDRLPLEFLEALASQALSAKRKYGELRNQKMREEFVMKSSCEMNDRLNREGKRFVEGKGLVWSGNHLLVIQSLPIGSRRSFTVFDSLFLEGSEVGKKIAQDFLIFKGRGITPVFTEASLKENEIVVFGTQEAFPNQDASKILKIKFQVLPDKRTLAVKSWGFPGGTVLSPDLKAFTNTLRGTFLSLDFAETSPLGAYPQEKNLWLDEGGKKHFEGDGHDHK